MGPRSRWPQTPTPRDKPRTAALNWSSIPSEWNASSYPIAAEVALQPLGASNVWPACWVEAGDPFPLVEVAMLYLSAASAGRVVKLAAEFVPLLTKGGSRTRLVTNRFRQPRSGKRRIAWTSRNENV